MKDLRKIALALSILALPLGAAGPSPAQEPLQVVATIPDLADITRRIGGDRVSVTTLTKGRENLHAVAARPSHLVALSRADMYVQIGLSLEAAFAPGLLEGARNRDIQPGAPGFVNVSEGWEALDVPVSVDRRGGDLHPHGNPHLNLDPRAGRHMAQRILEALVRLEPGSRKAFEERHGRYLEELERAERRWSEMGEGLRDAKVVVYHQEYAYLAAHYGLEVAASIESRPGIPPTPNHLASVIATMKAEGVRVILSAPWSLNRDVKRVAEATGARIVTLPNQAGGTKESQTWIAMMDSIHRSLDAAFGSASGG